MFVKFVQGNFGGAGLRRTMMMYCLDVLFGAAEAKERGVRFSFSPSLPPLKCCCSFFDWV